MTQQNIFDVTEIVKKKVRWIHLDERLVKHAYKALAFTLDNNRQIFRVDEIIAYQSNPNMSIQEARMAANDRADFQKLKYFGVVKKVEDRPTFWEITQTGMDFLVGNRRLKKKVPVMDNKVVSDYEGYDDIPLIGVEEAAPRWQKEVQDYRLDYQERIYKVTHQRSELIPANQ
ncbi:hypothetical protein M1506_00660 [Patescibacteria group bacterium]|jgi:hypothetical protein|nr:hypothetical protein [Patescibacteria group bacterium]